MKRTVAGIIRKILKAHPEGLGSGQIVHEFENIEYATTPNCIKANLSLMANRRVLRRIHKARCECCRHSRIVYRLAEGADD